MKNPNSIITQLRGSAPLAGAVLFLLLAATPAYASAPAPDRATARYEIRFMEEMIDHHFMAVQMAQLCQQRAVHQDLRSLCNSIVAAQSSEITQMQNWLSTWYGVSYQPEMTSREQAQMNELASKTGADFEIMFMQMMIQHHSIAISRAEECVDKAYHPELLDLCENIIRTQSAEIRQMTRWLCNWYGICDGGRKKK